MSVTTIEFKRAGNNITVNTPQFGYRSEIHLAAIIGSKLGDGKYKAWDNTVTWDNRYFIGTFNLGVTQQTSLQEWFSTYDEGRGVTCQMKVPPGIFPFGTDLGGGTRRFQVRLIEARWGSVGQSPWLWSSNELKFALVSAPDYSIPSRIRQGNNLQIGTIDGFRHPPTWYQSNIDYAVDTRLNYGKNPHSIDHTNNADCYETLFTATGNETLIAHVIDYLVNTARVGPFHIICDGNSFPFGTEYCETLDDGAGDFTVRLLDNVLVSRHLGVNRFDITLKLGLEKWYPRDSSSSVSTSSFSISSGSSKSNSSSSHSYSSSSSSILQGCPSSSSISVDPMSSSSISASSTSSSSRSFSSYSSSSKLRQ